MRCGLIGILLLLTTLGCKPVSLDTVASGAQITVAGTVIVVGNAPFQRAAIRITDPKTAAIYTVRLQFKPSVSQQQQQRWVGQHVEVKGVYRAVPLQIANHTDRVIQRSIEISAIKKI